MICSVKSSTRSECSCNVTIARKKDMASESIAQALVLPHSDLMVDNVHSGEYMIGTRPSFGSI